MNKMNPKAINVYVLKYWDDEDNRWEIDKVTSNIGEALKWDSRGHDYCYNGYSVEVEELEQLTKAKVVLRNIIDYLGQFCSDYPDCVIEAEQFLRETDINNAIQKANEGLNLDKIAEEVEDDLREGCPDVLCENCTEEDCTVRKLGLIC